MKKHRNYLIIPISNITVKDDVTFNVGSIFRNNYVSIIHRYIILKISDVDIYNDTHAHELLTHERFHFNGSVIKTILSPDPSKEITAYSESVVINIKPKLVTAKEVREFYREIINHNEADDYRKSVRELLLNNKKKLSSNEKVKKREINN